jgi:hypothetical protein
MQKLLTTGPPSGADTKSPDLALYRQLSSLGGPLLLRAWRQYSEPRPETAQLTTHNSQLTTHNPGLDPALFGRHPGGAAIDPASLCVRVPSVLEVPIPADLAAGAEFVTTAMLHPGSGAEGSVQMQPLLSRPPEMRLAPDSPVLTADNSAARRRFEQAFDDFRALFPAALAYTQIVPVDEVVTLTLFYREDEPLRRLMVTDTEARELDRLWSELQFVSQSPLKLVTAYEQISEFAT